MEVAWAWLKPEKIPLKMKEVRPLTTTQDRIPPRAHALDNLVCFTNTYPLDSDLSLF